MNVFISREQAPDSIFNRMLETHGIQVAGCSLIELSALPISDVPACDWVFFSSKNAAAFFFRQVSPLAHWKLGAIGPATANALLQFCPKVDFIGTGEPAETAGLFAPLADQQRVLFPAARHSREGVQRHLPPSVHCIDLEVYDNRPKQNVTARDEAILVFTSPMNVKSYFLKHTLRPMQKAIAIGPSTLAALQESGASAAIMAVQASETAMAEAVLRFCD